MNLTVIIVGSVAELIALLLIVRLWRRRSMGLVARVFWSVFLLVPFVGLATYGFIHADSGTHPIKSHDTTGKTDAGLGDLGHD